MVKPLPLAYPVSGVTVPQSFAVQVGRAEKEPSLWQVTSPDPEYPALQVTETTAPKFPEIEPVPDLSEFAT